MKTLKHRPGRAVLRARTPQKHRPAGTVLRIDASSRVRLECVLHVLLGIIATMLCATPALAGADTPNAASTLRVPVTRDNWVSDYGSEREGNNGAASRLKTKGIQEMSLLDIDAAPLRGRVVKSATLRVRGVSRDIQRRLTVSTVATDWMEGRSSSYRPQAGASSFLSPAGDQRLFPWSWPGSDLTGAMCGAGHTLWRFAEATAPDKDGWQTVPVDPRIAALRIAGVSSGFALIDDVGSEYERNGDQFKYHLFLNRFIASRESGEASAPYFTVELGESDRDAPPPVRFVLDDAGAPTPVFRSWVPADAVVRWLTPADKGAAGVVGFDVRYSYGKPFDWGAAKPVPRYLIPLAREPGLPVTLALRDINFRKDEPVTIGVRAVDGAGNAGEVATHVVTPKKPADAPALPARAAQPFKPEGTLPKIAGVEVAVIDSLDKLSPLTGELLPKRPREYLLGNHLWSASNKLVRLHAGRNEFVPFQVALFGQCDNVEVSITFEGGAAASPRATISMLRNVASSVGPMPDPLVPVTSAITVSKDDGVSKDIRGGALFVDVYVPHTTPAGTRRGTLTLRKGGEKLDLTIELNVWRFTLPDHLSFVPEMNCYSLPSDERAYYRLAHEHRTNLNRLPYNWRGAVHDGCAPEPGGAGDAFRWEKWDARFGPLLDGSLFKDLPRAGVPVDTFYLPISENWPASIDAGFKGGYWADESLTLEYRDQLAGAFRAFAAHFHDRKWNDTAIEFYLNGKVFFKEKGGWKHCSAPWIFDEPVNTQDFWALRWYAMAMRDGVAQAMRSAKLGDGERFPMLVFRADVSRPQWQRDLLDGVLGVNVVGADFRKYHRLVTDRVASNNEFLFNYGSTNAIETANTQPAAWCIDAYTLGADGVLPWQTLGTAQSWKKADTLSLFYPGDAVGSKAPLPSVRLKAYRAGQQAVEYLAIWEKATRSPRWSIAQAARKELALDASVKVTSSEDAGTVSYDRFDPQTLWSLRLRVGEALDTLAPPAERRLFTRTIGRRDAVPEPPSHFYAK